MTGKQEPTTGGVFGLQTPCDLLDKLGREKERMRAALDDPDIAFNFFVTAWHILDWLYPGDAGKKKRGEMLRDYPLLRLTSHLANGAKHFTVHPNFKSVVKPHGVADRPPIPGRQPRLLVIEIGDDVRPLFDSDRPYVMDVAEKVWSFWHEHFAVNRLFK